MLIGLLVCVVAGRVTTHLESQGINFVREILAVLLVVRGK